MKSVKLSTRLFGAFAMLTALLTATAALAFYGLAELNGKLDDIARVNNVEARLANELRSSIVNGTQELIQFLSASALQI